MGIITVLKEQCSLGFTGKVNILLKDNGQFVGEVLILDGSIVGAQYRGAQGPNSLFKVVLDDIDSVDQFKYVVEPEVIEPSQQSFEISFEDLKRESEKKVESHRQAKSLRPPDNLALKIRPGFIQQGESLSLNEFEILCSLIGKKTVGEVYKSTSMMETEVTSALVSLRKKNAFVVIGQS